MTRAFVTYVRPLLECLMCLVSLDLLKHIKRIESIQKRFTKRLPNIEIYLILVTQNGIRPLDYRYAFIVRLKDSTLSAAASLNDCLSAKPKSPKFKEFTLELIGDSIVICYVPIKCYLVSSKRGKFMR